MSIWTQRVKDLSAAGMTYADIASAIGLAPSTVGDLAAGKYKQPRADAAVKLQELHAVKCPAPSASSEAA